MGSTPGDNRRPPCVSFRPRYGCLDYGVGALLIVSPWLFGFANGGIAQWLPIILGLGAIGYSLVTDYELGVWPAISMRTHLALDAGSGVLLAASPWLFGFSGAVLLPHLMLGLIEIGAAAATRKVAVSGAGVHERF